LFSACLRFLCGWSKGRTHAGLGHVHMSHCSFSAFFDYKLKRACYQLSSVHHAFSLHHTVAYSSIASHVSRYKDCILYNGIAVPVCFQIPSVSDPKRLRSQISGFRSLIPTCRSTHGRMRRTSWAARRTSEQLTFRGIHFRKEP
jgi:hypothetical protein